MKKLNWNFPMNHELNMSEFADYIDISYRTLKRYIDRGKLVPRKTLGGKSYFLFCDVFAYKNHTSDEPLILAGTPIDGKCLG